MSSEKTGCGFTGACLELGRMSNELSFQSKEKVVIFLTNVVEARTYSSDTWRPREGREDRKHQGMDRSKQQRSMS